jgi:large subunit ribosomal protein L22
MAKGYTVETKPESTARARGYELDISPKKAYEVCNAIRGMNVEKAEKYLEDVVAQKQPVPIRRYNQETAHKKGHSGPGRYPVKAAGAILKVIRHAKSNAEFRGFDPDELRLVHIAANRGRVIQGRMPRAHGRSTEWNEQTTTIEVILEKKEKERGEAKKK